MNFADPWSPSRQSWLTQVDEAPGGVLVFSIRHEHDNPRVMVSVGQWRCTVREPAGDGTVWTAETAAGSAVGRMAFLQWPAHFGGPLELPGRLLYQWQGLDRHGRWHVLAYGDWQNPAAPPVESVRRPRSWRPRLGRWRLLGRRP